MSELKWRKCSDCGKRYPATLRYFPPDKTQPLGIKYRCRSCMSGKGWREVFWHPPLGHKRCSRCAETKPNSEFNRSAKALDGFRSECKACQARDGHGGGYRPRPPLGMKQCAACGQVLPITPQFFGTSRTKDGKPRAYCLECIRKKSREWGASPDARLTRLLYRRRHRDKINANKREKYNSDPRNRARRKAEEHRRRAKKQELPARLEESDVLYAMRYWGHRCVYCGCQQGFWNPITLDHFIPLDSGGGTVPENMVPACLSCNASKRNAAPDMWVISRFGARRGRAILRAIEDYFNSLRQNEERAV